MNASVAPATLGDGVWLIDTLLLNEAELVGVYVQQLADGSVALVEAGSGATTGEVIRTLGTLGIGASDVTAIVVTHVHLDHAAGAGTLAAWSHAPVYVHPLGQSHLVDPSRLWRSAARIYGDGMDLLWGPMEPVPSDQLRVLEDGVEVRIGGSRFHVMHTPGHANHHLGLLSPEGDAFVGDAAGIRFAGLPLTRPALPPPETDLDAAAASCRRIAGVHPQRLLLTHFGAVEGEAAVQHHLAEVPERNRHWAEALRADVEAGADEAHLVQRIEALEDAELDALAATPDLRRRYKASSDAKMTVMGLARYWRKVAPGAAPAGDAS